MTLLYWARRAGSEKGFCDEPQKKQQLNFLTSFIWRILQPKRLPQNPRKALV